MSGGYLTPEQRKFISGLESSGLYSKPPGNCMECGQQISSKRELEYPDAIFCDKCASIEQSPDTCNKL